MSYTASQLIGMGYGGYQGWGDAGANADFNATGGAGKKTTPSASSPSSSSSNPVDLAGLAQQTLDLQKQANAPAVQSLQSSIPEIQQGYATKSAGLTASKSSVSDQYDALLNSLVGEQSKATAKTFGARGIPLSSGMVDNAVLEQTQPIRQTVGANKISALQGIDSQLANLASDQTAEIRAVNNAIAQLQAGGASQSIIQALDLYKTQKAQEAASQAQSSQTSQVTAGGRVLLINSQTGDVIKDLGSSTNPNSTPAPIKSLNDLQYGAGLTTPAQAAVANSSSGGKAAYNGSTYFGNLVGGK